MKRVEWLLDGQTCQVKDVLEVLPLSSVLEIAETMIQLPKPNLICPYCKTTLSQLENELLVGCPLCYSVFEEFIQTLLESN